MTEREVTLLCYWNGSIKYNGPNGVYYEGLTSKKIRVKRKTDLSRLLDGLYLLTGLDKQRSKIDIIGRYPSSVEESMIKYEALPVLDNASLETMLEIPNILPSIKNVELYLEVKPTSASASASASSCSLKRKRAHQEIADECLNKAVNVSGVSKLSSLWVEDDHELRVGLCFKDRDELKKALDWCCIRGRRKCVARETEKEDMYRFECVRWKCKWSLCAARREEQGECFEITKYTGPHTCCPEDFETEFLAEEVERVVRVNPTLSVSELNKWWTEKTGYKVETPEMKKAKLEAMQKIYGDWDQSLRTLPGLMAALQSSNGVVVDWQYDVFPNPEFASFRGVFWAFSQSIEGFPHCRPLILVGTEDFKGKYPMKLMVASGVNAANKFFPLAFAFTKEVSFESWRWFLTNIREKVTQRKGLCLISDPHPEIRSVIKEPGSRWKEPWAYHRVSLDRLCSEFINVFQDFPLTKLVFGAGSTSKKEEFDRYMDDIKEKNPEARLWLDNKPRDQWALSHDRGGQRYGIMSLLTCRLCVFSRYFHVFGVPMTGAVLLLFDELRSLFDESLNSSRGSLNRGHVYTKPVTNELEEFMTGSATYVITPLERDVFQVSENDEEWIVQLNDSICSCGQFQANKFPCRHALAVCDKLRINPLQYVDDCYSVELYHKTYSAKFSPVPEVSAWSEASGVPTFLPPVIAPPPPPTSAVSTSTSTSSAST